MVVKVGSAGQTLESVIQFNQTPKADKPEATNVKKAAKTEPYVAQGAGGKASVSAEKVEEKATNSVNKQVNKAGESHPYVPVSGVAVEIGGKAVVADEEKEKELSREAIEATVQEANKSLQEVGRSVQFSYHEKTGRYSFKVVDTDGNVIREVPPEKALDMVAKMLEMVGVLVDEKK